MRYVTGKHANGCERMRLSAQQLLITGVLATAPAAHLTNCFRAWSSGAASPKFREEKMLGFGRTTVFLIWDAASQSTKWLDLRKIWAPPWMRPWHEDTSMPAWIFTNVRWPSGTHGLCMLVSAKPVKKSYCEHWALLSIQPARTCA